MIPTLLMIHHTARSGGHRYPDNSLPAVEHCLAAKARIIEVDISPLQAGDFLLIHDANLERATTGQGLVAECVPEQIGALHLVWNGKETSYAPALLSQTVALLAEHDHPVELQLDLKEHTGLREEELSRLVALVEPVRDRVRVTSCADWAVRHLRELDPELPLGFDPLLYLAVAIEVERDPGDLPGRRGPFGYWDDHPLASTLWDTAAAYLKARADILWSQAPPGCVWYLHARMLLRALDDGFDWIAYLHERGVEVTAWTLDAGRPGHVEAARRLISAGVDRITTNDAERLAEALGDGVVF